jgi:hypothetical protein
MLFKRAIVRATVNLFIVAALVVVSIVGSNVLSSGPKRAAAQDVTVVVEGPLQSINNNIWVVSNQSIEITTTTSVSGAPVIGSTVRIVAIQKANGKLIATTVTITVTTSPVATASATAAATPISTSPATQAVTPAATMRSFPGNFTYVKVIIEGPVESVDLTVNVIVVYKQRIRLRANDPIRAKIKKGDWVRCDGNLERDADNRIIIVVINIIIINPPPVVIVVQPGNSNPGGGGGNNGGGRRDDDDDDD